MQVYNLVQRLRVLSIGYLESRFLYQVSRLKNRCKRASSFKNIFRQVGNATLSLTELIFFEIFDWGKSVFLKWS
jgi:hypothetical protein